jgi:hypothetical protein
LPRIPHRAGRGWSLPGRPQGETGWDPP